MKANTLAYLLKKEFVKIPFTEIIMSLQTLCCGFNVFTMAKIITGIEIGFHIILPFYCALRVV